MLPFICAFLLLLLISETEEPVSERANYNIREEKREPLLGEELEPEPRLMTPRR